MTSSLTRPGDIRRIGVTTMLQPLYDCRVRRARRRAFESGGALRGLGWETNATLNETLETAQKALALDSGDNWARLALGWTLLRSQQFDEAEEQKKKAIALNRNDADCICWIANGLVCLGRAEEGSELISEAMRLSPLHPNVYHMVLGNALYFTGRFEDAAREFRQCVGLGAMNHANLAAVYGQVGRIEEARAEAKIFVEARRKQLGADGEPVPASDLDLAMPKIIRFRHQADRNRLFDGLRKAGLSE